MSKDDLEQTLIPKDDEDQWRKVLHGELATVDGNETHVDAATIRDYLIARDEAIAVNSAAETEDLSTLSEAEARIIYDQAAVEIKLRGKKSGWLDFFKTYGAAAVIGGLVVAVVFLGFLRGPSSPISERSSKEGLNYSDYETMKVNEMPGPFPNMLLIAGGTFSSCAISGLYLNSLQRRLLT